MVYKLVDQHQLRPYHEPIGEYGEILMCFKAEDIKSLMQRRNAEKHATKSKVSSTKLAPQVVNLAQSQAATPAIECH